MPLPAIHIRVDPLLPEQQAKIEPLLQIAHEAKTAHENAVAAVERGRAESKRLLQVHNAPSATPEEKAAARTKRQAFEADLVEVQALESVALGILRGANETASDAMRQAAREGREERAAMRLKTRSELVRGIGAGTLATTHQGEENAG